MKRCPRCEKELDVACFGKSTHKRDGLNVYCIPCMRDYRREHYANNKDPYKARAVDNVRVCREYVHKVKENGECSDCGDKYPGEPWLFEFDHLDAETKIKSVSEAVRNGSLRLVKEEIDKCELVCLICHRRRTALRAGWTCAILSDTDE